MRSLLRSHLGQAIAAFGIDRQASIAVFLSIALVPVLGILGLAADAARAYLVQSRLSQAVDSAALAGGFSITQDFRSDAIDNYFLGNYPTGYLKATLEPLDVVFDDINGTVEVVAQAHVPTTFLKVLAINQVTVSARAKVNRAVRGMELALVLDVTGSMAGTKVSALKTAAVGLLDILYGTNDTVDDLYVAVVPFAGRVRLVGHDDWFTSTPGTFHGCGDPRSGSMGTDDSPPSSGLWDSFYNTYTDGKPWYDATIGCNDSPLLPLTASKSTISTAINGLVAEGNTRTDIGMVWGWRALSPQWRGLWGNAELPLDYDEPLMDKAVIIMTDGENTPWQSGDPESEATTNNQLVAECTAMKAEGITIYTITFQAPASLDPTYQACASDAEKHFTSPSNEDLQAVFQAIGASLSNLRLSE